MTSKPSDDLLTRCRELLENRQMNDSSSPALCALADTFHPAIPPHVRLSMAELKTHREAMRTLLDNAQQPSGEVTAFTTTVGRMLATAPHFEECETPEPCLSALIHRYYENYFDREKGREHAEIYIAALYEAARAQGGEKS
ncbi:hypothetical protein KTE69_13745 [Burkholderia multivorans]|uniref:hypothetical protein n=1 Tax=Burkholderia multivorans TaxID=87883 RepID=UPI001C22C9F4|nr:hypothetical protein [Burkholderia multivorans]MBU9369435.1 hypothetical protein [Burkholderia multivorans]